MLLQTNLLQGNKMQQALSKHSQRNHSWPSLRLKAFRSPGPPVKPSYGSYRQLSLLFLWVQALPIGCPRELPTVSWWNLAKRWRGEGDSLDTSEVSFNQLQWVSNVPRVGSISPYGNIYVAKDYQKLWYTTRKFWRLRQQQNLLCALTGPTC